MNKKQMVDRVSRHGNTRMTRGVYKISDRSFDKSDGETSRPPPRQAWAERTYSFITRGMMLGIHLQLAVILIWIRG